MKNDIVNKKEIEIVFGSNFVNIDGETYIQKGTGKENKKLGLHKFVYEKVTEEDYRREVKKASELLIEQMDDELKKEALSLIVKEAVACEEIGKIRELIERLKPKEEKTKPTIKKKRGCFELAIGGKRGKPLNFFIAGDHPTLFNIPGEDSFKKE